MATRDYTSLLAELEEEYARHSPRSAALNDRAKQVLIDGGSHGLRLIKPFPPRIVAARGAWLEDEDGHKVLDFWQGHLANILGHNPEEITAVLAQALEERSGLQTGITDRLQIETAEILCRQTNAERVRFTTSGALSTMYSILLARAFTGRNLVVKVGGGWHGAQPWGLKGVDFHANNKKGFLRVETAGLPAELMEGVIVTRFNDPQMLHDQFSQHGDQVACFIVEPFIGAGGVLPATREYLEAARELTHQYGALLILDEVISGFRFRAGDVGALYGIRPDLATFGKVMGGGMPVAAVAGRADVMRLIGPAGGNKVKFSGGTYSAHPASLLAASTMMSFLVENEDWVYPRLAELGDKARRAMEEAFATEGIYARCTGYPNGTIQGSSLWRLHFPFRDGAHLDKPDLVSDPSCCDVTLGKKVAVLALLLEDVFAPLTHGAMSTAHTDADIAYLEQACRNVARRIKTYI